VAQSTLLRIAARQKLYFQFTFLVSFRLRDKNLTKPHKNIEPCWSIEYDYLWACGSANTELAIVDFIYWNFPVTLQLLTTEAMSKVYHLKSEYRSCRDCKSDKCVLTKCKDTHHVPDSKAPSMHYQSAHPPVLHVLKYIHAKNKNHNCQCVMYMYMIQNHTGTWARCWGEAMA